MHNVFRSKQKNLAVDGSKKSTPQKNLALTFFEKAFVRKWKKRQNSQNRMHKTGMSVQKSGLLAQIFSQAMDSRTYKTAQKRHFSLYFASSPWRFFVELFSTKNCKQKIWVFYFWPPFLTSMCSRHAPPFSRICNSAAASISIYNAINDSRRIYPPVSFPHTASLM